MTMDPRRTARLRRRAQARQLVRVWAPIVRSEAAPNEELHHRAHLAALIWTMLCGRYPL
jgi:hypothetical protein